MKKTEELNLSLRGKLMLTGTLAMFAMGTAHATATSTDKDEKKPHDPVTGDADKAEGQTRSSQSVHKFDIPAGTLGDVAAALQSATGVTIRIPEKYRSLPSKGVHGVLTTQEALTAALKGTDMSADFVATDVVQVDLHAASQDVTVTATSEVPSLKYTAPLRDLPQTITVIPEGVIENTASTSLIEALRTVPGIAFGAGEGGNPIGDRPYIRGQDSQGSTFVDGMRDIGAQSREVFDLESVEVSKGPSGSFAGRGAGGGSLNLNTKMARKDSFLNGYYSPGTANFFRGAFDGDTKLTSWFDARLNGMWQDSDMAGRDLVHSGRYGFAPAFLFNIGHRTRLFTNYYQLMSNDRPDPGMPYNNPTFFARVDGRAQVRTPGDGTPLVLNRNLYYGLVSRDFRHEKVRNVFGRAEYDVREGMVLRNTYRWAKTNQDYVYSMADDSQGNIYYNLLYRRALQRYTLAETGINQTDLAGQFKTGSIQHSFATGGEFSRERSWNATYTVAVPTYTVRNASTGAIVTGLSGSRCPAGAGLASGYNCEDLANPTPDDPWNGVTYATNLTSTTAPAPFTNTIVKNNNPQRFTTVTKSVYGFDTIRFIKQLQATLGIRYDNYSSAYRNVVTCVSTAAAPCSLAYPTNIVTYQAGVGYKPVTSGTIYASVSSSATPPGNSLGQGQDPSAITSITNQVLPPEKTRSIEGGVKWELFGTKALFNGAFFQANTTNVRIAQADGSISSVGERRNRGLDIGVTGYLNRKWQVFGGYTYMNAILVNAGFTGGTPTSPGTPSLQTGRHFPNTPEHSFSITTYYQVTRKLNFGGGVYGASKVFGADNPTTIYTTKWVPGYARVDIYGAYRINSHLEFQGNIQNLNDKTYFLQAYTTHFAQLAPGRQGRLTMNVRW
ncbi:MAG TPA: TonB-dependent receptor [Terriglobus sp.]